MPETKASIIKSGAFVGGIGLGELPGIMNMVAARGVEPTTEEANAILRAGEEYSRSVRGVIDGWLARTPPQHGRRKTDDLVVETP